MKIGLLSFKPTCLKGMGSYVSVCPSQKEVTTEFARNGKSTLQSTLVTNTSWL